MKRLLSALILSATATGAMAAPVNYDIDPTHTFPSFEADHMGISVWRGKINKSSGKVVMDREAGSGSVDIVMDLASIDFGHDQLNKWAIGKDFFDVKRAGGKAQYRGKLTGFEDGAPTEVQGELTMHGVTQPVTLKLNSFKCVPHPMLKRELCGADAAATINREAFGLTAGKDYGFSMDVALRIQVEAVAAK
ncbi:YceI family protein [Pseudoduganella plicata]|uniref:Polyisoprenoid-binding protein n=1 Tax=Pseudoduganella plicata TaxID=321984 RepID=A0A4P7BH09_9BURK|nr:YceI family protein [Pseudoduganella plicata]QBQ37552.1 polyisoprenoid-binding protein [Pseudoduganella plicata]GGY91224.1 polyisoprenoid-binding protein [Pseudoduganella plicata]